MEVNILLLLFTIAGYSWIVAGSIGRNQWLWPILGKAWKWVCLLAPGQRVLAAILKVEKKIENLADNLALLRLRQEAIENYTHSCIVITNGHGDLIWASYPFLNLVEQSLSEVRGSNWINCIHQDDRLKVANTWKACVETGSNFVMDFRYWQPISQKEVWVTGMAKAAYNPFTNHIAGYTATIKRLSKPPGWAAE